jgi:D-Tyr-tRNAtyr deacylase
MYTATFFEKRARQHTLAKYFKEKYTSGMKCELLNEKPVTVQLKV